MNFTFDQVQKAFINGSISIDQFVEVLVDNFGKRRAKKILIKNLEIALDKEKKSTKQNIP